MGILSVESIVIMMSVARTLARTAPLVYPEPGLGSMLCRIKYWARGLAFVRCSKQWFGLLHRPELAIVARHHPYIYCKLQRPYLNRMLNPRQRLETLEQHYRFVATRFSRPVMEGVYATRGIPLATIQLEEVGNFEVRLCYGRHEKEGDLLVSLVNLDTAKPLFEMSFSISRFETQRSEVFIGGLQGRRSANEKESIIALTRAMHGLRPKALLVFALQQLAVQWGITDMRAVSNNTHIYQHPHKRKVLATDYDLFWLECGGKLGADGTFELPAAFVPRDISAIKVNKRQMYRRRYVLLGQIADQISHNLGEPDFMRRASGIEIKGRGMGPAMLGQAEAAF